MADDAARRIYPRDPGGTRLRVSVVHPNRRVMSASRVALSLVAAVVLAGCAEDPPALAPVGSVTDIVFLTQIEFQESNMDALYVGRIHVDDRKCVRLDEGRGATVIWPSGFAPRQAGEDVHVVDHAGRDIGRIGDVFWISGGEVDQLNPQLHISYMDRAMAAESCPGKYWIAAEARRANR